MGLVMLTAGMILIVSGLFIMRCGLKKLLWNKLYYFLSALTDTPLKGLIVGILSAMLLQSSTAVSLITIGLVSANYLTFHKALGVILGANIGTCSTVQIMALSPPINLIYLICTLTLIFSVIFAKIRSLCLAILGLTLMFLGTNIISQTLNGIWDLQSAVNYLSNSRNNPIWGILGGIVITTLIQSSSAATAVLMVLADEGIIDITTAAYIVYGNNIGSCLSSLVVGLAAPLAARQVAISHILLNILGVIISLPFTSLLVCAAEFITGDFSGQVAMIHTIFNVVSSLAILPVFSHFANLVILVTPGQKK